MEHWCTSSTMAKGGPSVYAAARHCADDSQDQQQGLWLGECAPTCGEECRAGARADPSE